MTGQPRPPHVGKGGRYECPYHGDTLIQAEATIDLSAAFACYVVNCAYWSRLSLVGALTGAVGPSRRPGAPPPPSPEITYTLDVVPLASVCICVSGRSRFCKAHDG